MTPTATALGEVASWVAGAVDDVEEWFGSLTAAEVLLLVAALAAAYWLIMSLRSLTRLGPVEVATLEHDAPDDKAPPVNALTAVLRERLGSSGLLPPPEVPAGSPQTNLIAAVETSGAPQAPWVAKLLEILPQPPAPPGYKLHGTLIGTADDPGATQPVTTQGIAYWLQPKNRGIAQLSTVDGFATHPRAIERAAADIFLAIAAEAIHVFPRWAQWESVDAFMTYLDGMDARLRPTGGDDRVAMDRFAAAAAEEPGNALPRLQLANLLEKHSTPPPGLILQAEEELKDKDSGTTALDLAREFAAAQAAALGWYLNIAGERPELTAARYRASVVAAMLAPLCRRLGDAVHRDLEPLARRLGVAPGELADALETLSRRESVAVRQQLRLVHVLLRRGRFRHRYEPRGFERRRLRRTVAISRHTARVRALRGRADWWARVVVRARGAWIRFWHLLLFRGTVDWNGHYNAGCFYALVYARVRAKRGRGGTRRLQTLRRRAYEQLAAAIDDGGASVPAVWLSDGDPDLDTLRRQGGPEWRRLVARRGPATPGAGRDLSPGVLLSEFSPPKGRPLPEPAWGDPRRMRVRWTTGALLLLAAAVAVGLGGAGLPWVAGATAAAGAMAVMALLPRWRYARLGTEI